MKSARLLLFVELPDMFVRLRPVVDNDDRISVEVAIKPSVHRAGPQPPDPGA